MASQHLQNHLLSHRKRSAFSQDEVAFLLGMESGAKICAHERFTVEPGLHTALAYEVIYNKPVSQLFPGLVEQIQSEISGRATQLAQAELRSNTSALTARKRQILAELISLTPDN
jgi:hypothetical protein